MKLIIDIPKVFYEYCKAQEDATEIELAVKNGTPIPDNATVCDIEQIRAEIEKWAEDPCVMNHGCGDEVLRILDKYTKGDTDV